MTGGSLGLRTGSNGSLHQPQQGQNGQSKSSFHIRKSSKGSINFSREKEKCLPWLRRNSVRTDVGMLILVTLALIAYMTGWFTLYEDDTSGRSDFDILERFRNQTYHITEKESETQYTICNENNNYLQFSPFRNVTTSNSHVISDHPCKNFAFPPPPPGIRRRIGPRPCPVCYVPVEQAIASMPKYPSHSPILQHLTYYSNKISSNFGGYPSLKQRSHSYNITKSMTVHCGFVKGCRAGEGTGFDIDESDRNELEQYHDVIVASAIFGNYDLIQQPKNVSEYAKKNVPFYMFIDEETEVYMKNSSLFDSDKRVGLWRVIVVHNIPYSDARRNGKVPKLLLHRLFPNVRFSIWIDGKLQLVKDPYQILERFLWRKNATFAISRHYKRFDVFEEAEANKAGGKYDNVSIDTQIDFYRNEGLTPYTRAKLPITSDVPEGCVIVKEHIPITNLFTCLWFNEVDRFTSRDQLSFSTVRDKIMAKVNWSVKMFLDCERRNFVVQAYHRDLLEQRAVLARARTRLPPPVMVVHKPPPPPPPVKKLPVKRAKRSRKHRKVVSGDGEHFLF